MNRPNSTLIWMAVALLAGLLLAFSLAEPLSRAFHTNAAFNGVIFGAFLIGVLINLRQVLALNREISWVEGFRRNDPARPLSVQPRLLMPMARMLQRREGTRLSLTPASMRSLLDSIRQRLDESRELSRYFTGLLVFLGLLGTFWGLLDTIGAVGQVIKSMSYSGTEAAALFDTLKQGLERPLDGMGTAFSSSLFGLAGSLVLGLMDLQAGHAQNRFFNELEEWLSGLTRVSSGPVGDGETSLPAYVQGLLEATGDSLDRLQRVLSEAESERSRSTQELGEQLRRLNEHLGARGESRLSEDLRHEFRLLARTLAAAQGGPAARRDD